MRIPLTPAALAFVPFGIVLVRVRVRGRVAGFSILFERVLRAACLTGLYHIVLLELKFEFAVSYFS